MNFLYRSEFAISQSDWHRFTDEMLPIKSLHMNVSAFDKCVQSDIVYVPPLAKKSYCKFIGSESLYFKYWTEMQGSPGERPAKDIEQAQAHYKFKVNVELMCIFA